MKNLLKNELVWIVLLTAIFLAVVSLFSPPVLRIVLGLPFVLFFPGYTLVTALFPRKVGLSGVERVLLSFGMSVAVVPLLGLVLNYTPWGIRLYPILFTVAAYIMVMAVIAGWRRYKLPPGERFEVNWDFVRRARLGAGRERVVNLMLGITLLAAVGTLVYAAVSPKMGEKYTEFYILGLTGMATGYPTDLKVGQEGKVIIGIVNHEQQEVSYTLEVTVAGVPEPEMTPIVLQHDAKWEQEIGFTPQTAGEQQQVKFILYKGGESYRTLRLRVNVTP